jgi:hypothetical protein
MRFITYDLFGCHPIISFSSYVKFRRLAIGWAIPGGIGVSGASGRHGEGNDSQISRQYPRGQRAWCGSTRLVAAMLYQPHLSAQNTSVKITSEC